MKKSLWIFVFLFAFVAIGFVFLAVWNMPKPEIQVEKNIEYRETNPE
jgi:hypothetical protein